MMPPWRASRISSHKHHARCNRPPLRHFHLVLPYAATSGFSSAFDTSTYLERRCLLFLPRTATAASSAVRDSTRFQRCGEQVCLVRGCTVDMMHRHDMFISTVRRPCVPVVLIAPRSNHDDERVTSLGIFAAVVDPIARRNRTPCIFGAFGVLVVSARLQAPLGKRISPRV